MIKRNYIRNYLKKMTKTYFENKIIVKKLLKFYISNDKLAIKLNLMEFIFRHSTKFKSFKFSYKKILK